MSRILLRRLLKWSLSAALLIVIGARLVPPLIVPVARDAVVDSQIIRVQSPSNGIVVVAAPVATKVQAGQVLATVEDPLADDQRLRDLELRDAESAALLARLRRELQVCEALVAEKDRALADYLAHVKRKLGAELETSELKLANAHVLVEANQVRARMATSLQSARAISKMDALNDKANESLARHEVSASKLHVDTTRELAGNPVWHVLSHRPELIWRSEELRLQIAVLKMRIDEAETIGPALNRLRDEEKAVAAGRARAKLTAPCDCVVNRVNRQSREYVRAGETIVEVRDAQIHVAALFTRRYAAVPIGSRAEVTTRDGVHEGTVVQCRPYRPDQRETPFLLPEAEDLIEVKIALANPHDRLAVGLPVDVVIVEQSPAMQMLLSLRRWTLSLTP